MSKKGKGGKTPSAKATRNLEALKKAKEAVVAKEAAETPKAEDATDENGKQETSKVPGASQNVHRTPVGKTAHETHVLCTKHPNMCFVSAKIKPNEKGNECVEVTWKNSETKEVTKAMFPSSQVTEGDRIDLEELRGNKKKDVIPGKLPESAAETPKAEDKQPSATPTPAKKEQKKPKQKKPTEPELVEAEEVIDVDKTPTIDVSDKQPSATIAAPAFTKNSDRIDSNRSVDLMGMLIKRREEAKDDAPELYKAMGQQSDLMMWTLLQKWNSQFKDDMSEQGFKVNDDMFKYLYDTASLFLGVKLIGSKENDGQMRIDFEKTVSQASEETKEALKQDAAVATEKKQETVIPKPEECTTDDQKVAAMQLIANIRHKQQSGGIGKNLVNLIDFTKVAFGMKEDAEPAAALALAIQKMSEKGIHVTLIEGAGNAVWGNLNGNLNVIAAHAWLKNQLSSYTDEQTAKVLKVFLSKMIENKCNGKFEELSKSYSTFISSMNDDLINRIITSAKNNGKDENKLVYPSIKGLDVKEGAYISATKTVNNLKTTYGAEMPDKMLKSIMQKLNALYVSTTFEPLAKYVEKSVYAEAKK